MTAGRRVLLGVTGSIAAVKAPEIVRQLTDRGFQVSCVLTKGAEQFVSPLALSTFTGIPAVVDIFGPEAYKMPHLQLADTADVMLVAPATATIIGRFAHGIADDLVTLCYLSTTAPVLLAPAMHNTMWEHPAVQDNVKILQKRGVQFVGPHIGPLADNTRGEGRMLEPDEIVRVLESLLSKKSANARK